MLTVEEKTHIGKRASEGPEGVEAMIKKYGICSSTVYSYRRRWLKGLSVGKAGRPAIITDDLITTLKNEVIKSSGMIKRKDFEILAHKRIREQQGDCGSWDREFVPGGCDRTVSKIIEKMNLKCCTAEVTTNARMVAETDIRSMFSFAGGAHYVTQNVDPPLILNMDATQFGSARTYDAGEISRLITQYGEVSEKEMTDLGIPETTEREGLSIHQRRFVLLTHPTVIQRELDRKREKAHQGKQRGVYDDDDTESDYDEDDEDDDFVEPLTMVMRPNRRSLLNW